MKRFPLFYLLSGYLLLSCTHHHGPHATEYNKMEAISKSLSQHYPLELIICSIGDTADDPKAAYGLGFICRKTYTLEQARPMLQEMAKTYISAVEHDPIFLRTRERNSPDKNVAIKIAFWDANIERYMHPYLAQAHYKHGAFYYYYASAPTGALLEPIVENW